jgi:hypothetical protein
MKAIKINTFIFSIVFKRLFNKGNRKHFFRVPIEFRETLVKVWGETRNCVQTLALRARPPTQFLVSPDLSRVFLYNSIETQKMFSIFSFLQTKMASKLIV